tara:strand:- start:865 stop:1080 length:216 start_codon:yes stop_codon:yes gene_type:complete
MRAIRQHRERCLEDEKSRWWRDGLFCGFAGVASGLVFTWSGWGMLVGGLVAGLFGMRYGTRFLESPDWRGK